MQRDYWFVIAAGIICGTIILSGSLFFAQGVSLFEMATLPFAFALLFLLPLIRGRRLNWIKSWRILLFYGIIQGASVLLEFSPLLFHVPVAVTVLLLYTQPFWTVLFTFLFLKERITRLHIISSLLVVLGCVVLLAPWNSVSAFSIVGVTLGLLGGLALTGWIMVGSVLSKRSIDPVISNFAETAIMLLMLVLLYPFLHLLLPEVSVTSFSLQWSWQVWLGFIGFALITQVAAHLLYLYGTRTVPTATAGVIMLLEPVSAALLSLLFLGQILTWNILVGGVVILFSNYLILKKA